MLPQSSAAVRFQQGRNGAKLIKRVTELTVSGKELVHDDIAEHPPYENLPISVTHTYHHFESKNLLMGRSGRH